LMIASQNRCFYLHDQQLLKYRIHGNNTLSEGAILAREQDQQVIRKYLLAVIEQDESNIELKQARVNTGIDRLITLEHELLSVKAEIANAHVGNVNNSVKSRVKRAASKLLSHKG